MIHLYTLAQARFILSHVYCVHHVPEDVGSRVYPYSFGAGEAVCSACPCREPADLRLYVASDRRAAEWLVIENDAVQKFLDASVESS